MTTKIVRGQVIVFTAQPKSYTQDPVTPQSVNLYLSYVHAGATQPADDPPIPMELQSDGETWLASFDTQYAEPGAAFASIRSVGPGGAQDFKFSIIANVANPEPTTQ